MGHAKKKGLHLIQESCARSLGLHQTQERRSDATRGMMQCSLVIDTENR